MAQAAPAWAEEPPAWAKAEIAPSWATAESGPPASANLPETLNVAGFETGIPLHQKTAAFLASMGGRMASSYRGAKQILGLDEGQEAENEAALRRLSEDPDVGGYATAGGFLGLALDPVTLALPVAKGGSLLNMAKYGAAGGAAAGAISPVEEGGSRAVNTVMGAAGGAVMAPAIGTIARRLGTGQWAPLREPGATPAGIGLATTAAEESSAVAPLTGQEATKQAILNWKARQTRALAPDLANPAEVPIQEVLARRRAEFGGINPQLAAQSSGGAIGAATGAATADENATPVEIASRALIGGVAGWQFVKFGTNRIGMVRTPITAVGKLPISQQPTVDIVGDASEPLFKLSVSQETTGKLTRLAGEFFSGDNKVLYDPKVQTTDNVVKQIAQGNIGAELLGKYGLSGTEFAPALRAAMTEHGRAMAHMSRLARAFNESLTAEERAALGEAGQILEDTAYVRPFWKKLTDAWRGLLVTQPATAMRNLETQVGRVGLDVIQAPMDNFLQRITGQKVTVRPLDGFEELMSLFQRNKESVDKILSAFPDQKSRLFQRYLSDIDVAKQSMLENSKFWGAVDTGVNAANILNRTQEFMVRRAIFQTSLSQQMRNQGKDLTQIIANNEIGAIPTSAVRQATLDALNKTFAETPAWGTMSRKLIDAVNAVPGANLAIPFPRFMYNAIKFQYEYSPFGILSYLSAAEREAFAAGNVSKVSKAVIGSGLFGAAMLMRNSDNAGEKWYEWKKDNGDVVDLRPFNPFASYLFAADVLKKWKDGTLYKLTGKDIAMGLLSTNMRAGTGLYLLDSALNLMSKSADESKLATKAGELAGDFLAGFVTPLTTLRDAYDQMTEGQSTMRDTRQEFLGPIKSRLPVISQTLPEAELATREGPKVTVNPLLRQGTGLTVSGPKNALEKELDRLGFEPAEILPSTGDREIDREYRKAMGIISERMLVPMVESDKFQGLTDTLKGVVLHEILGETRNIMREIVNEQLPVEKQMKLEIKKESPRVRFLLQEFGVLPQ